MLRSLPPPALTRAAAACRMALRCRRRGNRALLARRCTALTLAAVRNVVTSNLHAHVATSTLRMRARVSTRDEDTDNRDALMAALEAHAEADLVQAQVQVGQWGGSYSQHT